MEFKEMPKIPRLSRNCVITEKIDGTNGLIAIGESGEFEVGSRSRWLQPDKGNDNFGFARWAYEHKDELMQLGPGFHYGEWWGLGIQRGYAMKEKVFSLFNVARWRESRPACCRIVPVLWEGLFNTADIQACIDVLTLSGSHASPGFINPEGIVIYHEASRGLFKKTILKDEKPKGSTE